MTRKRHTAAICFTSERGRKNACSDVTVTTSGAIVYQWADVRGIGKEVVFFIFWFTSPPKKLQNILTWHHFKLKEPNKNTLTEMDLAATTPVAKKKQTNKQKNKQKKQKQKSHTSYTSAQRCKPHGHVKITNPGCHGYYMWLMTPAQRGATGDQCWYVDWWRTTEPEVW